jgi:hypothetical protein
MREEVTEQPSKSKHNKYLPVHGKREFPFYHLTTVFMKPGIYPEKNQEFEDNQKITPQKHVFYYVSRFEYLLRRDEL